MLEFLLLEFFFAGSVTGIFFAGSVNVTAIIFVGSVTGVGIVAGIFFFA